MHTFLCAKVFYIPVLGYGRGEERENSENYNGWRTYCRGSGFIRSSMEAFATVYIGSVLTYLGGGYWGMGN